MVGDESAQLRPALERLRLGGALFLRAEYTDGWAYESPSADGLIDLLQPDAEQMVLFHIVAHGTCWIEVDRGERHWATEGDVIVLPYADRHQMGGKRNAATVPIASLLDPPPWDELPEIRHGEGGPRTDIVCGYLHTADPLFDRTMRALPPVFVVRPSDVASHWVKASIEFALERAAPKTGRSVDHAVATRLPELLLIEVLHQHLASAPAADRGWLAALHDPILAPAMSLMHGHPERKWTVSDLAGEVAVSRSVLDDRFRRILGRSPMRYLTDWRLHMARDLLANTEMTVGAVASDVGYDSQEAFSRAFKRATGEAPSIWRVRRRTSIVYPGE